MRVPNARYRLGGFGRLLYRRLEKSLGAVEEVRSLTDRSFTKERAPDLQHQVNVIAIAELQGPMKAAQRRFILTELQQRLAKSGESILVLRFEHERILKAASRPTKLFASQLGVSHSNVQLYRVRVERESLSEHTERLFILAFIVKLMGALVVLFRTQERGGHRE